LGRPRQVVLDTHKWIYWVQGDPKLPLLEAEKLLSLRNGGILVPAICLVEISQLCDRGRIQLQLPLAEWFGTALAYPGTELVPITPAIATEAYALPSSFHRDPADRLIVATARVLNVELMTDDQLIRGYPHVDIFKT